MYEHCDHHSTLFSLHDCHAEKMTFESGVLSFCFPDGFWVTRDHPLNTTGKIVKTGPSEVKYRILDKDINGVDFYVFTEKKRRNALRVSWGLENFLSAVNGGAFQVEFITQYQSWQSVLHKCWIWFDRGHKECEIILQTDQTLWCWDELCPYRVW